MNKSTIAENQMERRKQKRLGELGNPNPVCIICGHDQWFALEQHHIAGRKHGDELATVCRNCHRALSEYQKDHPQLEGERTQFESTGYLLVGLSELFALLANSLKTRGLLLIHSKRKNTHE
jgi:hypothetical protein